MRYAVLSFDLDGTLVDTAGEIAEAANRTIEDFGVERRPPAEICALIGAGTRELMLKLLSKLLRERPLALFACDVAPDSRPIDRQPQSRHDLLPHRLIAGVDVMEMNGGRIGWPYLP